MTTSHCMKLFFMFLISWSQPNIFECRMKRYDVIVRAILRGQICTMDNVLKPGLTSLRSRSNLMTYSLNPTSQACEQAFEVGFDDAGIEDRIDLKFAMIQQDKLDNVVVQTQQEYEKRLSQLFSAPGSERFRKKPYIAFICQIRSMNRQEDKSEEAQNIIRWFGEHHLRIEQPPTSGDSSKEYVFAFDQSYELSRSEIGANWRQLLNLLPDFGAKYDGTYNVVMPRLSDISHAESSGQMILPGASETLEPPPIDRSTKPTESANSELPTIDRSKKPKKTIWNCLASKGCPMPKISKPPPIDRSTKSGKIRVDLPLSTVQVLLFDAPNEILNHSIWNPQAFQNPDIKLLCSQRLNNGVEVPESMNQPYMKRHNVQYAEFCLSHRLLGDRSSIEIKMDFIKPKYHRILVLQRRGEYEHKAREIKADDSGIIIQFPRGVAKVCGINPDHFLLTYFHKNGLSVFRTRYPYESNMHHLRPTNESWDPMPERVLRVILKLLKDVDQAVNLIFPEKFYYDEIEKIRTSSLTSQDSSTLSERR